MITPDFKDIVNLVKKGATVEAQEKIMELREAMLSIHEENIQLKNKLAKLEEQLRMSSEMQFKKPFYFKSGDDQPFCPLCWEKDKMPIHLIGPYGAAGGTYYKCNHCKTSYKIKGGGPPIFTALRV